MKIATWNVNSIRTRQPIVTTWLETNPVDVLCLQETKTVDKTFPYAAFEALGYHCYTWGQKAYNGVAILSKTPATQIDLGFAAILGDSPTQNWDEQKRVLSVVVNDLRIVNLYVPNGSSVGSEKYEYKLGWFALLKQYLETLLRSPQELCVCGDFNVALEDRDIYQPKKANHIMASAAEREALQASILALGLRDSFRLFTQEGGHFSWWDYRQGGFLRDRGWRIDHLYVTPSLGDRALTCTIDKEPRSWEKPSDHTPVILEIK
ncbi:MAG: exodeoxyribonuclease III [Jaaginema sp. PMC 1079.18]|nr:exodeoxyribonuclease III [Jaaginema sp. PMC 1080.18]MEC4852565.1 exodeoxyribonuclease III [Jaaginema sp. PMC 1079.18]MEC4866348.1 exodeoxyribonuclease III [Jaaginema sp. PMC 1078.18]